MSSAKARLSTPPEQTPWDDGQVKEEYQQRVKSAALIRDAHTRTGKSMFKPQKEKKTEKQERYSTSYSNHFTGTAVRPPSARPSSPTRRNNPHPTQVRRPTAARGAACSSSLRTDSWAILVPAVERFHCSRTIHVCRTCLGSLVSSGNMHTMVLFLLAAIHDVEGPQPQPGHATEPAAAGQPEDFSERLLG